MPGRSSPRPSLWPDRDGRAAAAFAAARRLAGTLGLRLRLPLAVAGGRERAPVSAAHAGEWREPGCDWPWRVTYQGVVQPCCMVMGSDRATLGDLRSRSFAEIWAGPEHRDLRAALLTDRPPEVCRGCALYRGTF